MIVLLWLQLLEKKMNDKEYKKELKVLYEQAKETGDLSLAVHLLGILHDPKNRKDKV
ncbi:hypothetical protein LCGC14_2953780 [marine sediment metagenome]|uniref:Uncharacterized protein n=1 Tax=marine sediment metagenome TaxID=412755 RepID=A0A0F8Y1N1_9ZZZZ